VGVPAEPRGVAIEPVADVGGRSVGLSTAKGSGNFFHETYTWAKQGYNRFKALFWPWNAAHERDEAWYADKKANMPDWQLHQEYPSNDVEAFIRSGRTVFDVDVLIAMQTQGYASGYIQGSDFVLQDKGQLRVFELPTERGVSSSGPTSRWGSSTATTRSPTCWTPDGGHGGRVARPHRP